MLKKIFLFFSLSLFVVMPSVVMASDFSVDLVLATERVEIWFEFINLILSVIVAVIAVRVAFLVRGGSMEHVWIWLMIAVLFFTSIEFYDALNSLNILKISGLRAFLETFLIVSLLIASLRMMRGLKILANKK